MWRVGLKGFEVEEEDGCNSLRQHWHSLFEGVPVVRGSYLQQLLTFFIVPLVAGYTHSFHATVGF